MDIIWYRDCLLSRKFNLIERDNEENERERIQKDSFFENAQGSKKYAWTILWQFVIEMVIQLSF